MMPGHPLYNPQAAECEGLHNLLKHIRPETWQERLRRIAKYGPNGVDPDRDFFQ